jgi:HK97 family phage major capsid protein
VQRPLCIKLNTEEKHMKINTRQLSQLLHEASTLSNKPKWTREDERRNAFLLSAISAVKIGADLDDVQADYCNEIERANELPITHFPKSPLTREQRERAEGWKAFVNARGEQRDMAEGNPVSRLGTYSGLGFFVPTGFWPEFHAAMAQADVLFDEESVTLIKTETGNPLPLPTVGDIENVASVLYPMEGALQSETDIFQTDQATVGAFTYRSPMIRVSMESFQDLNSAITMETLLTAVMSDRVARGAGADLVNGAGGTKPLGLLQSLSNLGIIPIVATGASNNNGSYNSFSSNLPIYTGANSIGTYDLANLKAALNPVYLTSPKTAWLMNNSTLGFLDALVDMVGQPANFVKYDSDGFPRILGIPVKVTPSIPSIGASNVTVVLGDLSYWCTRLVTGDPNQGIKVYTQAPNLVEKGQVGFRVFARVDGALMFNDTSSPAPFVVLQQHS